MKKLSIITINYNNRAGLQRTIESVLPQLTEDIEFIVIDGGSTDGSTEVIAEHQSKLTKWMSEKDEGVYYAQNKGLALAEGEYCLFLNSGDYLFETTTLKNVLPSLKGFDIVYGNMKIVEGKVMTDGFMPDVLDFDQMMIDTLWHPVSFIKRELFSKFGNYNTKYRICADYDFFFKVIVIHKVKCLYINYFISVFELGGLSSDAKNVEQIRMERATIQAVHLSALRIFAYNSKQYLSDQINRIKRWLQ